MSINMGRDKEEMLHTYNGIWLCHTEEWSNGICSNMGGTRDRLIEGGQKEKGKYPMMSYAEFKIWCKWTYLWNKNRLTENWFVAIEGEGDTAHIGIKWIGIKFERDSSPTSKGNLGFAFHLGECALCEVGNAWVLEPGLLQCLPSLFGYYSLVEIK